jgi:TPR repeat protein
MPGANVSHERMRAENYLGIMHQLGQGVLQDDVQAVRWFRLAAGHGYASAQESLGGMIQAGNGVLQDDEEAVKWYRMAAEQGHASAQYKLGLMFSTSQSSVQDNVRAHMWYNISVANGSALGGERRDEIVDEMTPADVSKAQAMARECMSSGYEDCGWGWGWW